MTTKALAIQQIDEQRAEFSKLSTSINKEVVNKLAPYPGRPLWSTWQSRSVYLQAKGVVGHPPSLEVMREAASEMGKYYGGVLSACQQTRVLLDQLRSEDHALKFEAYFDSVCPYSSSTFTNSSPSWDEANAYYDSSQKIISASIAQLEAFKQKIMASWPDPSSGPSVGPITIYGQVSALVIGNYNNVHDILIAAGQTDVAQALDTLKKAVLESHILPDDQKEEHIEALTQIGEEAAKPKPNRIILKVLVDTVLAALKAVPDVAGAVTAVMSVLNH